MFSYLGLLKEKIDQSVYARGIRLYLEGKISQPSELDLEYWREYEVFDRLTYTVRTPVYHLAMKRGRMESAQDSVDEFTRCSCEYYQEMGICKHIVAVFASMEQEFGFAEINTDSKQRAEQIDTIDQSEIFDKIFEVDVEKKSRRWEHEFEAFLSQSVSRMPQSMKNMITAVNKDPVLYSELLDFIRRYSLEATQSYNKEQNLVQFVLYTLHYNTEIWVEMWLGMLSGFLEKHQQKILLELWIIIKAGANKSVLPLFTIYIKNLSEEEKTYYVEELRKVYHKNKDMWLDFVQASFATNWLCNHYSELDPLTLLRFAPMVPDKQEDFEIIIADQLKQWGDFLIGSDYDEIIEVFQKWRSVLGRSSYYEDTAQYYKNLHSKKRKLLAAIEQ